MKTCNCGLYPIAEQFNEISTADGEIHTARVGVVCKYYKKENQEVPTANDRQVGGEHYRTPIQPWDFVVANGLGFLEGNAIKYIARHKKTTSGKEDLEKAIHYLQKAIEVYYT